MKVPNQSEKSGLRWPGGKTKVAHRIAGHVPSSEPEVASIFLGGGSVELVLCGRGTTIWAYDNSPDLITYWEMLLRSPDRLANRMESLFLPKMHVMGSRFFYRLQQGIGLLDDPYDRAAAFFTLNRASFSGTTLAGGMSSRLDRLTRRTVNNIRQFSCPNLRVRCLDFRFSVPANADRFLFLDPPYALPKGRNNLYGVRGRTHRKFDHLALYRLLRARKHGGFVLCYNDCDFIRDLYKDYRQISLKWPYGMNKSKKSSELLIVA
jgi:DNA adenine methylase